MPGRGEAWPAQAAGVVRAAGGGQSGGLHHHADGEACPRGHHGIPADQPSARLPDLRSGRRVRPAGPVDRLWPRPEPVPGEQARRHREVHGSDRQDGHDPVHPVHALRPLRRGSVGRGGDRRDLSRREHADHLLSRRGGDERAQRQRGRSVPGRCADQQAVCLRGAAVGAEEDADDRRHGRGRHQHPARQPRAAGAARGAAHQRGRQRGVGDRQDAPRRRRPGAAPARSPLCAPRRQARARDLGRGVRCDRGCRQDRR